jgi:hypothetical protein
LWKFTGFSNYHGIDVLFICDSVDASSTIEEQEQKSKDWHFALSLYN